MRALAVGGLANNAILEHRDGRWSVQGDPTEGALLVAVRKAQRRWRSASIQRARRS